MALIDTIPNIQQLLKDSKTDTIKINLTGMPANGRYPEVKVFVNRQCYWQGIVQSTTDIVLDDLTLINKSVDIGVQYINKTDQDTKVVDGQIVENQRVQINWVEINHLKLSGHKLINYSSTDYDLTDSQKDAYTAISARWEDIKTDVLYNNGTWKLYLKKPIITTLLKQKNSVWHVFETPHLDILHKLQQYFTKIDH